LRDFRHQYGDCEVRSRKPEAISQAGQVGTKKEKYSNGHFGIIPFAPFAKHFAPFAFK
jgi:hypothetical protein